MINIQKFGNHVKDIQPDFIFCTGDLNNAYPDDHDIDPGFKAAYRPPQTYDLMESFKTALPAEIPTFMIAGNHDLTSSPQFIHVDSYEKSWGQTYYHFRYGGRIFIAIESQYYRSDDPGTVALRNEQMAWLEELFQNMPKDEPKTVFQHAPLFVATAQETDSELDGKTVPKIERMKLLDLFCANSVTSIYSGSAFKIHCRRN